MGRLVIAAVRERGLACVVSDVINPLGHPVYRIAQSEREWLTFAERERSRIERIEAALRGMYDAWQAGGLKRANSLFSAAPSPRNKAGWRD